MYFKTLSVILFSLLIPSAARAQYGLEVIHFTVDGKAGSTPLLPGFTLHSCWNGIGAASNGKIYIAISNHLQPGGNVAVFKYEPGQDKISLLGDLKSVSTGAGNWMAQESQHKVHTFLLEHADGKMYFATDDYEPTPFLRGSHLYTIDTGTDQIVDLSRTQPYVMKRNLSVIPNSGALSDTSGIFIQYYGIQNIGLNKRAPDLLYAVTYPDAHLIRYNLADGAMERIAQCDGYIYYVDNDGDVYFMARNGQVNFDLMKYDRTSGRLSTIALQFEDILFRMVCPTQGGDTVYCFSGGSSDNGDIWRLVCSEEKIEFVTTLCGTYFGWQANLTLSPDGRTLYYFTTSSGGWERFGKVDLTSPGYPCELIMYIGGAEGSTDLVEGRSLSYGGINVWDKFGNFYVPAWEYHANIADPTNIAVLKGHTPEITDNISDAWQAVALDPYRGVSFIPNPFSGQARIKMTLPRNGTVDLSLFDVNGTLVKTVVNGHRERGIHFYGWDGTDGRGKQVRPGVYFCYLNGIMQNKVFYTGR